jgi:hypothetical protein
MRIVIAARETWKAERFTYGIISKIGCLLLDTRQFTNKLNAIGGRGDDPRRIEWPFRDRMIAKTRLGEDGGTSGRDRLILAR